MKLTLDWKLEQHLFFHMLLDLCVLYHHCRSSKIHIHLGNSLPTATTTLMSFERVLLVKYACQIRNLFHSQLEGIGKIKVDNRQDKKKTCQGYFNPGS